MVISKREPSRPNLTIDPTIIKPRIFRYIQENVKNIQYTDRCICATVFLKQHTAYKNYYTKKKSYKFFKWIWGLRSSMSYIRIHNINLRLMQFLSHRNITYHVPVIELQKYGWKKNIIPTISKGGIFLHYFFFIKKKKFVYKANEDFTLASHNIIFGMRSNKYIWFVIWQKDDIIFFPSFQIYILIPTLLCYLARIFFI